VNKFSFKILFLYFENIENQVLEFIEVFEKKTYRDCPLIYDCLHWHLKGN
jgi:hypothetical protein